MSFLRSIPLLSLSCLLAACAAGETELHPATIVRDSAGIQLVHNPDPVIDTTSVTLTERLRIGVMDGPEVEQFFGVRGIAIAPNGTLYISNRGSSSVRVFSAKGEFLREIGRRGTGPGEFDIPGPPLLWKDTLYVSDGGSNMVHGRGFLFDTAGNLRGTTRYFMSDGSGVRPQAATTRGWLVSHSSLFRPRPKLVVGTEYHDSVTIGLLDARSLTGLATLSRAALDSTIKVVARYPQQRSFSMTAGGEGIVQNPPLFEPMPGHAFGADGRIHVARGWPLIIDVFEPDGRWLRRISRAHTPVAITDGHVQEYLRRADAYYSRPKTRSAVMRAVVKKRADMPRIGFLPVTGRLHIDRDNGAIWVERVDLTDDVVAAEWNEEPLARPSYWDVFSASGEFRRMVRLPPRYSPRAIHSGVVYGVQRDENDVEFVVALSTGPSFTP